jgi:hypothetical protein
MDKAWLLASSMKQFVVFKHFTTLDVKNACYDMVTWRSCPVSGLCTCLLANH